jgi:hypothetical protein
MEPPLSHSQRIENGSRARSGQSRVEAGILLLAQRLVISTDSEPAYALAIGSYQSKQGGASW